MKKYFALLAILFASVMAQAQSDYKVVFDITNKDSSSHKTVIRQSGSVAKASPEAQVEVVVYSGALDMVVKDKSTVAPAIEELIKSKQVTFKVCALTMKRNNVDKSQLIPGVVVVDDGIYEIITRQRQGWGYIKVAN
jgi:intracellular sulfur oxidation DsrE/DsrF family protein